MKIAIVGGGPAGASLAWHLAKEGMDATVFEDSHPREKPCGGGVTQRGWEELPLLETLDIPTRLVTRSWYVPPSGKPALVPDHEPVHVCSRKDLDQAILTEAVKSGAHLEERRVRSVTRENGGWTIEGEQFDFVAGADGPLGICRRTLDKPFAAGDRLLSVGYYLPGSFPSDIWVEFFPDFFGYAWFFPREDHASVGIGALDVSITKETLYRMLKQFLARRFPDADLTNAKPYGGSAPGIKQDRFHKYSHAGDRWAMIGDAAGFCDPTTGEGIYYAFASARLLAKALKESGDPAQATEHYRGLVAQKLLPELMKSSRFLKKFYQGWVLNASMFAVRRSKSARRLAADFIAGRQGYLTLRQDVYHLLPKMVGELLIGRKD